MRDSSLTLVNFSRLVSGTFMIAGTCVGAGILGIPLALSSAGFVPALCVTLGVWIFMLLTGFLLMEATLTLPDGANILSLSRHFLGRRVEGLSGAMFIFLYTCLMVSYIAAGAPILGACLRAMGVPLPGFTPYLIFTAMTAAIVYRGAKWIDRSNIFLTIGMFGAYMAMISMGSSHVKGELLSQGLFSKAWLGVPVLFGAFGYHNVIPSLCTYLERDRRTLRLSIFWGTAIACVLYLVWITLVLGSVDKSVLASALAQGKTGVDALLTISSRSWLYPVSCAFAFFAVSTSILGVGFSFVDFLADGARLMGRQVQRLPLILLTFLPSLAVVFYDQTLFNSALGLAGGVGEAFLNGVLPVCVAWQTHSRKRGLMALILIGVAVMGIELFSLKFC